MFHTPSVRCLVAICFALRWSATAAARLSSTATQLEPVEQEIKPRIVGVDTYDTCELSEGNYTMSNLSEILCASGQKLKDITEMHPNSSNKLVLEPTKPLRLVGKGAGQTRLKLDVSPLPGASLYLEALHFEGKIEVLENETSIGESKMSYLTLVSCSVKPPEPDAKQQALARLERDGIQDPSEGDASAWWGWLMIRYAALSVQIHDSYLEGGAFVKRSSNFNLSASNSSFDLDGQGFQLVNVTSHIRLEKVEVNGWRVGQLHNRPSFNMVLGQHEVHVAGSSFKGSAIQITESLHLILDVSTTQFHADGGQRAIVVNDIVVDEDGSEGHRKQVDLKDVEIYDFSEYGVGASVH